jgi:DNA-binding GntR family transcriptional regulator
MRSGTMSNLLADQSSDSLRPVRRESYRQLVRDQLQEAILSGQLRAGEHINETAMAARFGVSATPVREAFRELEEAGLIVVAPHRGAVVRALTRRDLDEMYSLRAHLERLAVRRAHPRLTDADFAWLGSAIERMVAVAQSGDVRALVEIDVDFHRYIFTKADHALLLKTWSGINPSNWTHITVQTLAQRGPVYIAERHWPVLDALKGGDVDAAEEAMAEHIHAIGEEVLRQFQDVPADVADVGGR